MTNIEKQVTNCLSDINEFHNDIEILNDADFVYKYNADKETMANKRILNTHNIISSCLECNI